MAITFVQEATPVADGSLQTSKQIALTSVAAGSLLLLAVSTFSEAGSAGGAVSDSSGDGWTLVRTSGSSGGRLHVWRRENASAGTHTLTFTPDDNAAMTLVMSEWSGILTASALDSNPVHATGTGTTATSTTSGTLAQADELVISFGTHESGNIVLTNGNIIGAASTRLQGIENGASFMPMMVEYRIVSATTDGTAVWTSASSVTNWRISLNSFKASATDVTVALTGVAATTSVGIITALVTAFQADAFQNDAFQVNASADVTVALSGVAATSAVGAVAVLHDNAITGVASTAAVGTVGVSHDQALAGSASTTAAGTVAPSTSKALAGVSTTTSVGTLVPGTTVSIAGVSATSTVGSITANVTIAVAGVAATSAVGAVSPSTTIGLTGRAVTSATGTITASVGGNVTVALTGVSMTASTGTLTVINASATGFITIFPVAGGAFTGQSIASGSTFVVVVPAAGSAFVVIVPPSGGPFS